MGANRYTNAHKNLTRNEVDWDVEIYDDGGSPVGTFKISGKDGVIFREEGPSQDPLPGIYPTSVDINFTVTDVNGEFMIQDIREKDRSRFAVKVLRDSDLVFVGRFSSHNMVIENSPIPYGIRLTAHDGLASLKHVDYDNNGTAYSGDATILAHIQNCFDKLDIQTFYAGDFIGFVCEWYNSEFPDTTSNPLVYTQVDHQAFRKDKEPLKCWDVLKKICIDWGLLATYSGGMFQLTQLSERADSTFERYNYDTSFALTTSGTTSNELTLDKSSGTWVAAGGTFGALDNLKSVDVLLPTETSNLALDQEWSDGDDGFKSIGSVYIQSSASLIRLRGDFESLTTLIGSFGGASEVSTHKYVWEIYVRIGTTVAGLKRELFFDSNGGTFWSPTGSVLMFIDAPYSGATSNVDIAGADAWQWEDDIGGGINPVVNPYTPIDLSSYPLDLDLVVGETYSVDMRVTLKEVIDLSITDISTGPDAADYQFEWWFRNPIVTVDEGTDITSKTVKVHHLLENDVEAERALIIDACTGDVPNGLNGLKVWDGAAWVYSSGGWRRRSEAVLVDRKFSFMLAHEIMIVRRTTKELYHGGIISHEYERDGRISYNSKFWLPLKGSFSSGKDLFNGTSMEVEADDLSGTTETETDVIGAPPVSQTDNPPVGDPPPGVTQNPPQGLITNEVLDDVSAYTTIQIVNQNGLVLDAGEYLVITNLSTGASEIVQITAALLSGSTTITIASYTFTNPFGLGSPIGIAQIEKFEWIQERFTADATDVSNGYLTVTGPISDPAAFTDDDAYFRWMYVKRGSSEVEFSSDAVAVMDDDEYGVIKATERVTFPDSWPMNVGEKIRVRYKIPRI